MVIRSAEDEVLCRGSGCPRKISFSFLPPQAASQNQLEEPNEISNTPLAKHQHTHTPHHNRHRSLLMAATCHQLKPANDPTSHSNAIITMRHLEQINLTAIDHNEPCP